MPRVSVVIPTYNQAHFLSAALDSVRAQTVSDWEALIVNNFSDDNTEAVALGYRDDRIRLINFHNHGVIAASRNHGVSRATADYVAFLDSDDLWRPAKLQQCLDAFEPETDVVAHDLMMFRGERPTRRLRCGPASRATWQRMLFEGNCVTTSGAVVRRGCLMKAGGFSEKPEYRTAEDYEFWLRLAGGGARFTFLSEVLADYRLHDANSSGAIETHLRAGLAIVDDYFSVLPNQRPLDSMRLRRRRADIFYGAGRRAFSQHHWGAARRYFTDAAREFPVHIRSYLSLALTVLAAARGKR